MSSNIWKKISQDINLKVNTITRPFISNLFVGLGIYHAIYTEDDNWQIPLAIIAPSIYIGYHSYKYFDNIKEKLINK
jgi:hypothetical protein